MDTVDTVRRSLSMCQLVHQTHTMSHTQPSGKSHSSHLSAILPNPLLLCIFAFLSWDEIRIVKLVSKGLHRELLDNISFVLMHREKRAFRALMYNEDTSATLPDESHGYPRLFIDIYLLWIELEEWNLASRVKVKNWTERIEHDWIKQRFARSGLSLDEFCLNLAHRTSIRSHAWYKYFYASLSTENRRYLVDHEVVWELLPYADCDCIVPHLSERLKDDKALMLQAVDCSGLAYKYASSRLQRDRDIIRCFMAHSDDTHLHNSAFQNATENLSIDKAFFKELLRHSSNIDHLALAANSLLSDPDFMHELLTIHPDSMCHISISLKKDRNFVLSALKYQIQKKRKFKRKLLLTIVSKELRNDREVVMDALRCNVCEFGVLSPELRSDIDMIAFAFEQMECPYSHHWRTHILEDVPVKKLQNSRFVKQLVRRIGAKTIKDSFANNLADIKKLGKLAQYVR